MLKALSVVLLVCLSANAHRTEADIARLEQSAEKCRQGTPVTKEWLASLYSGHVNEEPEESVKCYFKCILTEMDMWTHDGMIKIDENHGNFHDCAEKAREHMSDRCDMAYHFNKCVHMQNPELPIV